MAVSRVITILGDPQCPGGAARSLSEALYSELRRTGHKRDNGCVVQLHPADMAGDLGCHGWEIDTTDAQSTERWLVTELQLEHPHVIGTWPIIRWLIVGPRRAWDYMLCVLPRLGEQDGPLRHPLAEMRILVRFLTIIGEMLLFYYLVPILALSIIRPLRKAGGFVFALLLIMLVGFFILFVGRQVLPQTVLWVSNLTQAIVDQVHDDRTNFGTMFPIIAGVVGAVAISATALFARAIWWLLRTFTQYDRNELPLECQFQYLVSPAYAALLTNQIEKHMQALYSNPQVRELCVVADRERILVTYEVLSHMSKFKPSLLLTYNASVASMFVLPYEDTWLIVDSKDWGRFEKPLDESLSWHHIAGGLVRRRGRFIVASPTGVSLAQVQYHKKSRFNVYQSLARCLAKWPTE